MMTKKHFKAIAEILKQARITPEDKINGRKGDFNLLTHNFALYFLNENENFNMEKFLKASGYGE